MLSWQYLGESPSITALAACDVPSESLETAAVELSWQWLGSKDDNIQRFRVMALDRGCDDQTVAVVPAQVAYKVVMHNLQYNQVRAVERPSSTPLCCSCRRVRVLSVLPKAYWCGCMDDGLCFFGPACVLAVYGACVMA